MKKIKNSIKFGHSKIKPNPEDPNQTENIKLTLNPIFLDPTLKESPESDEKVKDDHIKSKLDLVKHINIDSITYDDINNNELINSNKLFNKFAKEAFCAIPTDYDDETRINYKKTLLAGSKIRCLLDELLDEYNLDSKKFDDILKSLSKEGKKSKQLLYHYLNFVFEYGMDVSKYENSNKMKKHPIYWDESNWENVKYLINKYKDLSNEEISQLITDFNGNPQAKNKLQSLHQDQLQIILAGSKIRDLLDDDTNDDTNTDFNNRMISLPEQGKKLLTEYINFINKYGMDVSKYSEFIKSDSEIITGGKYKKYKNKRRRISKKKVNSKRRKYYKRKTSRR